MLPEVGASELLLIAIVALIVVGPKDLPMLLRKLGQFMAKLRGMAADFRASFDEMARQSELDELRKEVEAMRRGQITDLAAHDAGQAEVNQMFEDIHHGLSSDGMQLHPPMSHQYVDQADLPPAEPVGEPKVRKPRAPAKPKAAAPKPASKAKAATTVSGAPKRRKSTGTVT
jgi:sec-independent protein translocase protein TatB